MSFEPVNQAVQFPEEEEKVLAFWQKEKIFEKSIENRSLENSYVFYDGPPFATGLPHYGHLLASVLKDIVPRYQTMKGLRVERRFGWDCHGLPIEYEIDKKLGISGSAGVKKFGIEKYNAECRSIVLTYTEEWEKTINRVGRWVDFKNDYKTMDASFMESVWWVFKELWDKGLVYEGYRVMPYSWKLATPLSNYEASSNYQNVQDPAITLKFQDTENDNLFYLAWTTTPWTLPSNLALSVGPDITYVEIENNENKEHYILSESQLGAYFPKEDSFTIVKTFSGKDLKDRTYSPLFSYFEDEKNNGAFRILVGEHVTDSDGTGIVHTAPAFGEDDFAICQESNIKLVMPVDDDGNFTKAVPDYAGRNVKDADKDIIKQLKSESKILRHDTVEHNYPFCWRSDTPLIYKAVSAWFVDVQKIKDRLIENNKSTHWVPEFLRDGRFGNWLKDARDWNISRNRFWGNPLPIWVNKETGEKLCFGSIKELEEASGQKVEDLHKDFVDKIEIPDPNGNGVFKRIPEVLDCWFESASMPYAQIHYPFENKEFFEKNFPAQFIAEGLDQTRGWFYNLAVLGTALFDKLPFQNVIVNGMILAEDGKKMSKRLKNYPDPHYVLDTYGADALRLYLINSPVVRAEELRFSENGVKEIVRRVLLKWWNSYCFFVSYANIDKWQPKAETKASENILDRWILSRLQSLLAKTESEMEVYHLYSVVPALLDFIEDLTNTYIRLNRKRFWTEGDSDDKESAYQTLYEVLFTLTKVMAPFTPFLAETMYKNLSEDSEENSVHLCDFPVADKSQINEDLERSVAIMERVTLLARNIREKKNIKVKIPLKKLEIIHRDQTILSDVKILENYLKEELNVRELAYLTNEGDFVTLTAKANGAKLGKALGKKFGEVNKAVQGLSSDDIRVLEQGGSLEVAGEKLTKDDVLIYRNTKDGFENLVSDALVTINLDTSLDEDQVLEGLAREVVNRIQKLRKTADLNLDDRIRVEYTSDEKIKRAITSNQNYIQEQTLALEFEEAPKPQGQAFEKCEVDKMNLEIALKVLG